jgi:hypothetical protein
LVAETLGVGAGVDPQAAMKIAMKTTDNSLFMLLSSLASAWIKKAP